MVVVLIVGIVDSPAFQMQEPRDQRPSGSRPVAVAALSGLRVSPRPRDGKPNLAAPTPRATWIAKPDLSGMWYNLGNEGACPPDIKGDTGECIEKGLGLGDATRSASPGKL